MMAESVDAESEVQDLETLLLVLHEVVRLQIPMDDAVLMSGAHGVREGSGQLEEPIQREAFSWNQLRKRLPEHELHGDEVHATRLLDGMDRHDVGVVEGRRRPRLAKEELYGSGVLLEVVRQEFHGDEAAEMLIARAVHHAHTALAQHTDDFVVSNPRFRPKRKRQLNHGIGVHSSPLFRRACVLFPSIRRWDRNRQ